MWVVTQYFLQQFLDAVADLVDSQSSSPPLNACFFGLFTAPTGSLSNTTVLADITEANYDGYARQLVTWYPPFISAAGPYLLAAHSQAFTPTDSTVPNTITGCFLASAATGGVYLCGTSILPTPIPLTGPQSTILVDCEISLPFTPTYGGPTLQN
jgi:hypothetical protein